ncbi:MAG: MFS transporter, partial [Gorillibacterium sp.]|nr:MFS transporter [Gorillibacterium sp.]
ILTIFIPIFVSAVYGGTATNAGFILIPMMLGSVAGSAIGGIFQTKTSYRNLMLISVASFGLGMFLLSTLTPDTARYLLTIYMITAGFGVGFSFSLLPTASNHNLEARYRGTANSTNSFLRSFGMTLGITIFGVIQGQTLSSKLKTTFAGMNAPGGSGFSMDDPQALFKSDVRAQIPPDILKKIVGAMSDSITHMFLLALIPIGIAAITVILMGNARVQVAKKPESESAPS